MLRSTEQLERYQLTGLSGRIGNTEGFLLEKGYWFVRYLLTSLELGGQMRKTVLSIGSIESVDRVDGHIYVNLGAVEVRNSPGYDPSVLVTERYREALRQYYAGSGS